MPSRTDSSAIEWLHSLSNQTGLELRSVAALAKANRISHLFDRGVLRRIDRRSPAVALRYLADVGRRWEKREVA